VLAAWWAGTGLLLALWPISLLPYRPAMILHPRVFAPLVLPGALLAGRLFAEVLWPARPRLAAAGALAYAALAVACTARIHQDGVRWRLGAEWARDRLADHAGENVLTDARTAELLRIMSGYAPRYSLRPFAPGDLPPPPGTLLVDNERLVEESGRWDGLAPPPWWRASEPRRVLLAELVIPPPFVLQGPRGAAERVVLSRVAPNP
jgi:hypothetical protein